MASKLILKKSSVPAKVPVAGDLEYGELALNYADGKLFYKTANNTISSFNVGGGGGASALDDLTDVVITSASTGQVLQYNGTTWVNASANNGFALTADQFTGDGTTLQFTLSAAPGNIAYTIVTVDGVAQTRGSAYTVSSTQLTFTEAPPAGTDIEVLIVASATIAQGVPVGGSTGNVLVKQSGTDYDTAWSNQLSVSTITLSNQLTSTVTTGTAPFVVSSTTRVANLNVATAGTADTANSVAWSNVTSKPTFATVATTGAYSDLSGTPTLATVATTGAYSDLSGTPTLATVATTGAYSDLSGTPTLATVATTGAYSDLSGTPDIASQISSAITTHESAVDPHTQYQTSAETLVTVATATGDIHGIVDRTASTLSFNETTREFSIAPVSGSWTYYHTGTLYTVSTTKTLTVSTTSGAKFIYIDAAGNLNEHSIPDFASNVYLCYIYWNNTAGRAAIFGDERHGAKRDTTWHSAQHQNVGTVWRSGGDLTYTLNSDSQVAIGVGTPVNIADEDLLHSITHSASPANNFEQILTTAASLEVIYLSDTNYTTTTTNTLPWVHSSNVAQYNSIVANSGSLASVTEGKYITYWMVATNDLRAGRGAVKLVLGRQLNDTVDQAYSESFTEYGLSFAEQVFMYQIVVQYSSAYTGNAARIRLAGIRKILAKLATTSVAAAPATSHSVLTGRSDADAHPIAAITNLQTTLDGKQATLVSGTNIKTINGNSVLGSGDLTINGGGITNPYPDALVLSNTTASSSTTTGALQVAGGVGISGNLNVGGTVIGGGVRTTSSSTAPSTPTVGDIWYDTVNDVIYRYTSDGTSSYWIDVTGPSIATSVNTLVTTTGSQTLTDKRITVRVANNGATTSGTITPTADTADQYELLGLTGTITVAIPSGTPTAGQKLTLRFKDNGSARTIGWITTAGGYRVIGTTLPITTTANKNIYVGCVYNATDVFWDVVAVSSEA